MDSGGGGRHRSGSPAAIDSLLHQLRALGLQGGHGTKTYAGLAAGRSSGALGQSGSGGYSSGSRERGTASAFFRRQPSGSSDHAAYATSKARGTPGGGVTGSTTPPSRPAARVATPDTSASPFLDEDILFQMSGLKPLRTTSRTAAAAPAAGPTPGGKQQQRAGGVHRTQSAPSVEAVAAAAAAVAAGRSPPLTRAFSFAGEPSPRAQAAPLPTVLLGRAGEPSEFAAAGGWTLVDDTAASETAIHVGGTSTGTRTHPTPSTGVGASPGLPAEAAYDAAVGGDEEAATSEAAAPVWSEELLNWMLSEKAGLLVEAQRAQRRQAELAAELERLRARSGGAEREVQRLTAERRSLLDRVQQLSAAEAEAAARAERLAMEADALGLELAAAREACAEMRAARGAARDALADVSAQNARLLGAYVEKKGEAGRLRDALHAHQAAAEARIRTLEAQLRAAQAGGGAVGQLSSPPPSPPLHACAASPAAAEHAAASPAPSTSSAAGSEPSVCCAAEVGAASTPQRAAAASPAPSNNDENANLAGNTSGAGAARQGRQCDRRQACAAGGRERWDEERAELLHLLERLQDQLTARAEQQAGGSGRPTPQRQPLGDADAWAAPEGTPADGHERAWRPSRAASNLEASFNSVGGSTASSGGGAVSDGGSPAVAAHHMADSPLPHSSPEQARSGAPSPPSAQQPAQGIGSIKQQQQQPQRSVSAGASHTLDAFLATQAAPAAAAPPSSAQAAEQERLQQAEQRAAELEAELQRLRQASAAAEERAAREERRRAAEAAKAAGNAAFQAGRFEEAVGQYSAGLEAGAAAEDAGLGAVLHCNRAAAHHACGRYLDALADCACAAALDPAYPRVHHRRADAHLALGAYEAAAQDLAHLVRAGGGPDVAARLADVQRRAAAGTPPAHYAVLGVKPAATPGEIRVAYRQLALRFHPDKASSTSAGGGLSAEAAGALFKLASEAHSVLGDPERRRQHDLAALRHKYRRYHAYC